MISFDFLWVKTFVFNFGKSDEIRRRVVKTKLWNTTFYPSVRQSCKVDFPRSLASLLSFLFAKIKKKDIPDIKKAALDGKKKNHQVLSLFFVRAYKKKRMSRDWTF